MVTLDKQGTAEVFFLPFFFTRLPLQFIFLFQCRKDPWVHGHNKKPRGAGGQGAG